MLTPIFQFRFCIQVAMNAIFHMYVKANSMLSSYASPNSLMFFKRWRIARSSGKKNVNDDNFSNNVRTSSKPVNEEIQSINILLSTVLLSFKKIHKNVYGATFTLSYLSKSICSYFTKNFQNFEKIYSQKTYDRLLMKLLISNEVCIQNAKYECERHNQLKLPQFW